MSIRAAVIGRDGSICRLCGDRVQSEGLSLVNVRPGMQAGELAELQIVLGCEECAAAADVAVHGRSSAVNRRTMRLLAFLYLENCQIAQTLPLRAVKS
ncbi:hypothetical protein [Nesterenkonia jeotgali]|uniref:hypothetical protein n=1 Tax=Nesterenkonia jeotgali TaxID=317018 RepID=UPI0012ECBEF1|nr:hypothetical protein [Nesterenkonia jeotgali]